jgi:hypothetical protein
MSSNASTANEDELEHVWVQVFDFYDVKIGDVFKIKAVPDDVSDVSDLRGAVKVKMVPDLNYCAENKLIVKKQIMDGKLVDAKAGDSIADICSKQYGTTCNNPIHIIAPRKQVEAKTALGTCFVDVPLVFGCSCLT